MFSYFELLILLMLEFMLSSQNYLIPFLKIFLLAIATDVSFA